MGLTGALTLNAKGDPNAVFIFQAGSTLTTASASSVILVNGAQPCNVFWQVGSSATLGTNSKFLGTIMADQSITVTTGTDIKGRRPCADRRGNAGRQRHHDAGLRDRPHRAPGAHGVPPAPRVLPGPTGSTGPEGPPVLPGPPVPMRGRKGLEGPEGA